MTDRYAVMGNPIAHSKSPQIHARFAAQTGQDLAYEAMLVATDGFVEAVAAFRAKGGKGLNITVPFKQEAWQIEAERTPRAQRAGAVNTLCFLDGGRVLADTTDGVGLVADLLQNGLPLRGQRVLILGAGGAVRGVIEPILEQQPALLVIANRTVAKADELVQIFADIGALSAVGFDGLAGQQFDLIINGTAASLEGEVPPIPDDVLAAGGSCYDMMYGKDATAFQRWAMQHGAAQALDGLGMLVGQAAESFYLWRGVRPEVAPVIQQLRAAMQA